MSRYKTFVFKSYTFDEDTNELSLVYGFDEILEFTEKYHFDFEVVGDLNKKALDRALQNLFFMAGVSYYKAYLADEIVIQAGQLDQSSADFFSNTWQKGLGEFFYVNQLDPGTPVEFPNNVDQIKPTPCSDAQGLLIGLGGGKDSLVSVELLRDQPKVATWSLNHREQLEPLVGRIGLPHFYVKRALDKELLDLNKIDALNGHIPISAIIGCVGTIVAILTGYRDVVVSNESSADEPTLSYQGHPINHQYSKSSDYEVAYQDLLGAHFKDTQRYYSFLRPLSEVAIAETFARVAFDKYQDVFSSCNRAFVLSSDHMSWCGECAKCAFTYLVLSPFVDRTKLDPIWGKNLLEEPALEIAYKNLLGIEGDKPLDCVGGIKESRAAMKLVQDKTKHVKYSFEIPEGYSYHDLSKHQMPPELFTILRAALQPQV